MSDLPAVIEYEIQLFKSDGSLSIIMTVAALGPHDAKIRASKMLHAGIDYAIIWQGFVEVGTVHRDKPN